MTLEALQLTGVREGLSLLAAPRNQNPSELEIRFDVYVAVRAALRERHVPEKKIKDGWIPGSVFDENTWGATLVMFERLLQTANPAYEPFDYDEQFATDTLAMRLSEVEGYFVKKIRAVI